MKLMKTVKATLLVSFLIIGTFLQAEDFASSSPPTIQKIVISGSDTMPTDTIRSKIPYHIGEKFDQGKTNDLIKNVYSLGYFKQIEVVTEAISDKKVVLHVKVKEKPLIKEIVFKGNKNLTKKELSKTVDFETMPAAELGELKKLSRAIKKAYAEKSYHFVDVKIDMKKEEGGNVVTFTIKEGPKSLIKKVQFEGNTAFHGKKLRSLLYTREDWIMGPMDKSGIYHPQALEADKFNIENFYQSNGYMNAHVVDAQVAFSKDKKSAVATFTIHEGEKYSIDKVSAPGNDIATEEQLLSFIPIRKGQLYSREMLRMTLDRLRTLWGDHGYIYADVEPLMQPDEKERTVSITFYSDLGKKVRLNRINIQGNEKTRDKVIRRLLLLDEGQTLTKTLLDLSKNRVEGLGYFDPKGGVNWKLNRLDEDLADIDIKVKEVKTGRVEFKLTYGGTPGNMGASTSGIAGEVSFTERNIAGKGLIGNLMARVGKEDFGFNFGFAQPWLFDRPIRIGTDGYYSQSCYEDVRKVVDTVEEKRYGGGINLGFISQKLWDTKFLFSTGVTAIDMYSKTNDKKTKVTASITGDDVAKTEYQQVLDRRYDGGKFAYTQFDIGQDTRNHHTHISRGYQWSVMSRVGIPSFGDSFGFYKFQFDGHYYTPLIDEKQLVLHLRAHLGLVQEIGDNKIPYRELYNMGGQASVRGWLFGQIGPMWYHPGLLEDNGWQGDAIGAKRSFFINAELVFPITEDLNFKGVVFYDGGSGWNTPDSASIDPGHLKNNSFKYRHSVGVGIRMLNPQPIRIDWGFKLDRETGEKAGEVSFSSYHDF